MVARLDGKPKARKIGITPTGKKRRKYVEGRDVSIKRLQSAITTGALLIRGVDHRAPWMRRLSDLIDTGEADLGGTRSMANIEMVLLRRASFLMIQCEMIESAAGEKSDGKMNARQLTNYNACLNAARRIYQVLLGQPGGLRRRQQDITPVSQTEIQGMLTIDA